MDMVTIPISIPKNMASYCINENQPLTFEQNAMLIYPLIHDHIISHGRAAELLGVPKWQLIDFYTQIGIPYLNQTPEEIEGDIQILSRIMEQKEQ